MSHDHRPADPRSVISECVLNALGKGRFKGYSAGSHPSGRVNPAALELLGRLGYDTAGARSKSWEEFAAPGAPQMDVIITVCDDAAGETCPLWPGRPATAHWGVADPSRVEGDDAARSAAWETAHRSLRKRIEAFIALPFEHLDNATMKLRLAEIGALV
jgi:arsenate reductase